MDPELSHDLSMGSLRLGVRGPVSMCMKAQVPNLPTKVWDITFPNPVGLAAGLDKHADNLDAMAGLGFGFVEVGTVTPRPQPGNPKPRLFRLPEHNAILNRFGFNSKGVDHLVNQVKAAKFSNAKGDVVGINIGKNKETPNENAVDDYLYCMERVYEHASYITVNISSPNTPGLRNLQQAEMLKDLVDPLKACQTKLADQFGRYVPFTVKIAPDLEDEEITMMADVFCEAGVDGLIATNTTLSREAVKGHKHADEMGGLSGAPVTAASTEVIRKLRAAVGPELPIIGVGGIMNGQDAADKIEAGANLVQVYSGFIYEGPGLIKDSVKAISKLS
jgi:dihydroorotate dehydrogenase